MTTVSQAYDEGATAAMSKFGATRGLKEIRKALDLGQLAKANRFAQAPGMFSPGQQLMGSAFPGGKNLGRGGEGLTTKVIHPAAAKVDAQNLKGPIAARKLFDPAGNVYSEEIARRKAMELADLPGMPKVLAHGMASRNTPVHINEFVAGRPLEKNDFNSPAFQRKYDNERNSLLAAGKARGFELHDLRPQNAMATPDGGIRFIDHMPLKPHEVLSPGAQRRNNRGNLYPANLMPTTPEAGDRLFGPANEQRRAWGQIRDDNEFVREYSGPQAVSSAPAPTPARAQAPAPPVPPAAAPGKWTALLGPPGPTTADHINQVRQQPRKDVPPPQPQQRNWYQHLNRMHPAIPAAALGAGLGAGVGALTADDAERGPNAAVGAVGGGLIGAAHGLRL